MNDSNSSLGQYLRTERDKRNVSLEQVAYATRISIKMLRALEEDSHQTLPAPTFVRGYLQAYGKYVRLDTQDLLLRYQHHLATTPTGQRTSLKSHYLYVKERYQEKKRVVLIVSLSLVVLMSAGAFFAFKAKRERAKHTQDVITEAPVTPPATEAVAPTPPITTAPAPVAAPAIATTPHSASSPVGEARKYNLTLSTAEDVWFRFQVDQEPVKDLVLRPGKTLELRANTVIKIFSGNLAGIKAVLNGQDQALVQGSRSKSAILPESEAKNYPLPLFPPIVKKETPEAAASNAPAGTPPAPANNAPAQ